MVSAYLKVLPPGTGEIKFNFNPLEYHVTKRADWRSTPQPAAAVAAIPQFQGSVARSFTLSIFLDSTEEENHVQTDVDVLFKTCEPTAESIQKGAPEPPPVQFGWGTNVSFKANMRSVDVTYKLFKANGEVIRAEAQISMDEIPTTLPKTNPSSGGLVRQRTHTLVAAENLALVSHAAYGTPTMWRALAEANGIDDPMRVPVGTVLVVPDRSEAETLA
jgi:nucleoid-associated protein YgaU